MPQPNPAARPSRYAGYAGLGSPAEGPQGVYGVLGRAARALSVAGGGDQLAGTNLPNPQGADYPSHIFRNRLAIATQATGMAPDRGGRGGPDTGGTPNPVAEASFAGARPSLGFSGTDRAVMAALPMPGSSVLTGALTLADRFFGPLPGVIGGEVAPRPGTAGFRDVVGASRAARATASLADRGNRSIGGTGL